ncbi:LOW QUALITY PROTEIN: hypothetical protein U9M48_013849 [Paspalum notatum var. saurae]|uniref:Integrase catalytic domain-containing protein n=1 Tax=Paspalum notatum var. saurae TaxID=547442 RepID=A0AAQ3T182_PASNO
MAKLSLTKVAFVRNLGFNWVSVWQLLDEGFEVHFNKGVCRVLDSEETLAFRVDLTSAYGPARCLVASPSADIWKWHMRLGHLSFDLLVEFNGPNPRIVQIESSEGFSLPRLSSWQDGCRFSCSISQVMTSYPGRLLHMDTVCPARVTLVSGKWYALVVVDDFSRFSWVLFMEFMDEAFVPRLRNESHKAMRAIRSDNGGEFRNSRFENLCCDLGHEH